jgi:hypothetical protein
VSLPIAKPQFSENDSKRCNRSGLDLSRILCDFVPQATYRRLHLTAFGAVRGGHLVEKVIF